MKYDYSVLIDWLDVMLTQLCHRLNDIGSSMTSKLLDTFDKEFICDNIGVVGDEVVDGGQ